MSDDKWTPAKQMAKEYDQGLRGGLTVPKKHKEVAKKQAAKLHENIAHRFAHKERLQEDSKNK